MIGRVTRAVIPILLACALWSGATLPCAAGAWMRGEGEGFLSLGLRAYEEGGTGPQLLEQSFFFEYGLWPRVTIGAQGNYTSGKKGDGALFLRLPVRNDDRPAKIAAEIGLGVESTDGITFDPFFRTGVSWGRGITLAGRGGWVNVDTAVQWASDEAPPLFKLDATLGLTLSDRFQVMGQGFFEADENGDSLTIAPSVIYSPKRWRMKFVVGLEHRTGREENTGVKFGIWREF